MKFPKTLAALLLAACLTACGGGGPSTNPAISPAENIAQQVEVYCAPHDKVFIMAQTGDTTAANPNVDVRVRCVDGTEALMTFVKATGERIK